MQVEAGRGYSDERAARDALFALLGAGVLVAAAPAKRRKALGLLAILAVLALFLWRRATATESAQVAAPEWERETDASETAASEQLAEELAVQEPVAEEEPVAVVVEAPVAEETVVAETAVEEPADEEVADEVAPAAAEAEPETEAAPGFEALDAALAALIGELERVETARREEAEIEEAQRAWREAQAEDAREHELAEAREREEAEALVHAGRQLVHAGGSDIGQDTSTYDLSEHALEEHDLEEHDIEEHALDDHGHEEHGHDLAWRLPEAEVEAEASTEVEAQAAEPEAEAPARGDASQPNPIAALQEPLVSEPVVWEPQAPEAQPVQEAPDAAPQRAPVAGGLVGLIGRYSHRQPGAPREETQTSESAVAAAPSTPAPELMHDPVPAVDETRAEAAPPEQAVPEQAVPDQAVPEQAVPEPAQPEAAEPASSDWL